MSWSRVTVLSNRNRSRSASFLRTERCCLEEHIVKARGLLVTMRPGVNLATLSALNGTRGVTTIGGLSAHPGPPASSPETSPREQNEGKTLGLIWVSWGLMVGIRTVLKGVHHHQRQSGLLSTGLTERSLDTCMVQTLFSTSHAPSEEPPSVSWLLGLDIYPQPGKASCRPPSSLSSSSFHSPPCLARLPRSMATLVPGKLESPPYLARSTPQRCSGRCRARVRLMTGESFVTGKSSHCPPGPIH